MDLVEAAGQPALVAVQRPASEPGRPRPAIPRHDPVVQREPQRRQLLVVDRKRRQPLEGMAEVVPEEADEPAGERRGFGGEWRRVEPGDEAARYGERVRSRGRRLQDGHRVGREVGPPRIASRARAFEQADPGQVAERFDDIDRSCGGDGRREAACSDAGRCRPWQTGCWAGSPPDDTAGPR